MTANEIIHRLYLGDKDDVRTKNRHWDRVIPVMWLIEPDDKGGVDIAMLDALADAIQRGLDAFETVLVHCWAGVERSPLVVAWYLCKHAGYKNLDEAYDFIQEKRQCVQRRTCWIAWKIQAELAVRGLVEE